MVGCDHAVGGSGPSRQFRRPRSLAAKSFIEPYMSLRMTGTNFPAGLRLAARKRICLRGSQSANREIAFPSFLKFAMSTAFRHGKAADRIVCCGKLARTLLARVAFGFRVSISRRNHG